MGKQVRRVDNRAGQWPQEGNIIFDKEGYR